MIEEVMQTNDAYSDSGTAQQGVGWQQRVNHHDSLDNDRDRMLLLLRRIGGGPLRTSMDDGGSGVLDGWMMMMWKMMTTGQEVDLAIIDID
jgi:hypothetical protein